MHNRAKLESEEQQERLRHVDYYKERPPPRILPRNAWERFDSIDRPTNGFVYAVKRLGNIQGKRILDCGCGSGWLSVILAKRGAFVDAIDISPEAIRMAERMAEINEVADRISFRVGSIYDLHYPENHFDCVIGLAILHHLGHKDRVVGPLHHIIKPGGEAVFVEAFGESRLLERTRLLIPVKIEEEDKTHWDEQFKYSDLDVFRRLFSVRYQEFQLLSRLDRIIAYKPFVTLLGHLDLALLRNFRFLRRYARTIVIELTKR